MALVTSLVVLFYCCATADILTKLLQQCFLIFIVVPWLYLGNSQVSVYRTIGPTLVFISISIYENIRNKRKIASKLRGLTKKLIVSQLLISLEYQTWYFIVGKTQSVYPVVQYANNLI